MGTPTVLPADLRGRAARYGLALASDSSFLPVAHALPSTLSIQVPELGLCTSRTRAPPRALGCSRTQVAECSSLGGLRLAFRGKLATPRMGSQGSVGGGHSWHCPVLGAGNRDPQSHSGNESLGAKPREQGWFSSAEFYSGYRKNWNDVSTDTN